MLCILEGKQAEILAPVLFNSAQRTLWLIYLLSAVFFLPGVYCPQAFATLHSAGVCRGWVFCPAVSWRLWAGSGRGAQRGAFTGWELWVQVLLLRASISLDGKGAQPARNNLPDPIGGSLSSLHPFPGVIIQITTCWVPSGFTMFYFKVVLVENGLNQMRGKHSA